MEEPKIRIYLDHNILDYFAKGKWLSFKKYLSSKYQIIYSFVTLNEIAQSPDYSNDFLNVLRDMDAAYMVVQSDDSQRLTDKMQFYKVDPKEAYQQHLENQKELPIPDIDPFLHKLLGGQANTSFETVINKNKETLNSILETIQIEEEGLLQYKEALKSCGEDIFSQLNSQINSSIPNPDDYDSIQELRKVTGTSPATLNNEKGPKIIEQIWEQLKQIKGMPETLDDYLGFKNPEITKLVNPNNTLYQNVCAVYTFLQMIGYWSERRQGQDQRHLSFINDQYHCANAIFTHGLFTRDKPLAKKAKATYQYLGINTAIVLLTDKEMRFL